MIPHLKDESQLNGKGRNGNVFVLPLLFNKFLTSDVFREARPTQEKEEVKLLRNGL